MKQSPHNLFYASSQKIKGDYITIDKRELHHVKNVLRIKKGDVVWLTDGAGNQFQTKITKLEDEKIIGSILGKSHVKRPEIIDLELAFVPLKGFRNDIIIEKGTELGVSRFRPFIAKYSIIKQLTERKVDRLKRIALSAMLQSQRLYLPDFAIYDSVDALMKTFDGFDLILLADRQGGHEIPVEGCNILFIIGPEGGLDKIEIQKFESRGVKLLSLGSHRLRSETAAITGIAKILSAYKVL